MKNVVGEYLVEFDAAGRITGLFKEFGGEVRGFRVRDRVRAERNIPPFVYVEDKGTVVEIRHPCSWLELIRVQWDTKRRGGWCNTPGLWMKFNEIARL